MNAVVRCVLAGVAGCLILAGCAPATALGPVSVEPAVISPNGDGNADIARLSYRLNADAEVAIWLTDAAGARIDILRPVRRPASPRAYERLFNGLDANDRLVPNGQYTWHIAADAQVSTGSLTIENAALNPPRLSEFTVSSQVFTPNRDAIEDHVYINIGLEGEARLNVYVTGADGFRQDIPREERAQPATVDGFLKTGRYFYDYDGGIDKGADPPPDGDYTLVAEAVDRIGQRALLTRTLTIKDSGRPVAEIVTQPNGQGIEWSGLGRTPEVTLKVGDTLYFTTTIRNVGSAPIRTAGPFNPDDCYKMDENRYTKGFAEEPGIWRVGVNFETNQGEDHPWRWAVGTLTDLDVVQHNGSPLYYLAPGKQVLVRGCITFTRIPVRNPFRVWGALIQEQVEISFVNSNVSPILVTLVQP
jgi:hypothetical protein